MRSILLIALCLTLSACKKADDQQLGDQPIIDIAPQRAELQKAKELEKKMQQDAEDQRKAFELQTNPK